MSKTKEDPILNKAMKYIEKQMKLNNKGGTISDIEIGENNNLWCHFNGSIGSLVTDVLNIYPQLRVWNMSLEDNYMNVVFATGTSLKESYVTYKG